MRQNKIFICCDGGLGNRMNTLLVGLYFAKKLNFDHEIIWPVNNWCGCSFDDLFESQNYNFNNNSITKTFENNLDAFFMVHDNQTTLELKNTLSHSNESLDLLSRNNKDLVYYHNKIPEYISTHDVISILSLLPIKSEIITKVRKFIKRNGITNFVQGCHIRRTDSPKQADINYIFNMINQDKNTKYFVCSDDENTEKMMQELQNVVVLRKNKYVEKLVDGDWNTNIIDSEGRSFNFNVDRPRVSIIEAFADMLILSRCNLSKLKNKSTFFGMAKLYSSITI